MTDTASWYTNEAILALCDELDAANREVHGPFGQPAPVAPTFRMSARDWAIAEASAQQNEVFPNMVAYYEQQRIRAEQERDNTRNGLNYEKYTSPYRHHNASVIPNANVAAELGISARELAKDVD